MIVAKCWFFLINKKCAVCLTTNGFQKYSPSSAVYMDSLPALNQRLVKRH